MVSDINDYVADKEIFLGELRSMGSRHTSLVTEIQEVLQNERYSEEDIWATKTLLSKCLDDQLKYQTTLESLDDDLEELIKDEEGGEFIVSTLNESHRYLDALEQNIDELMETHKVPDYVAEEFQSEFDK